MGKTANKGISVMIVEDIDEMRSLMEHILEEAEGISLMKSARNGIEARLELTRRCPQVLLLDEVLPGESSVDILREFVERGTIVILMTGLKEPDHPIPPEAFSRVAKPGWETVPADRERLRAEILRATKR